MLDDRLGGPAATRTGPVSPRTGRPASLFYTGETSGEVAERLKALAC
jgi:hypothetical protein